MVSESSFEECCCALCFLSFLHLCDFSCNLCSFLVLSFSKMAEERTTRSTTTEPFTNSYLCLHHGENPPALLVLPVLDSTNYHSWSRSIITMLSANNKVEFVLGTHPCPPTSDPTYSAWIKCNNMVVLWLVHLVSLPIRQSVIWMDVSIDVWNDLKTIYSQGDLSRISYL